MTCRIVNGQREWKLVRGEDGHRTYTIEHLVEHDTTDLGFNVLSCVGLPQEGDEWNFDGDHDPWAFCMPTATVECADGVIKGHPRRMSKVTQTFTTKAPDPTKQRCSEIKVEDPLLEPPKITFSYTKYTEEATEDRFGNPILYSSHEQIRGPQNEWDANRFVVKIEQNVGSAFQGYQLPVTMKDGLNDAPLWGYSRRSIKMTPVSGERRFYGRCNVYYSRVLEFEVRPEGFDRDILDEGSKLLHGHWDPLGSGAWVLDNIDGEPPDPFNASHFDKAVDKNGNPMHVILNGLGLPAASTSGLGFYVSIQFDNVGNSVLDTDFWIPLLDSPTVTPPDWNADTSYAMGNLVTYLGDVYVCLLFVSGLNPSTGQPFWQVLPSGLVNQGAYSSAGLYFIGEYVTGDVEEAGQIHVEKYDEFNLLLLGIPTTI